MTEDSLVNSQRHLLHSREYLENALIALQNHEAGKAGELLWGSVAQATHAVAAYRGHTIKSHRDLKNFVVQISNEAEYESLLKDFAVVESLHHNFYDIQQEPIDIEIVLPTIRQLLTNLARLVPPDER